MCWAECYGVYVDTLAGFRQGLGKVDNIFVLHGLMSHFINSKRTLFCTFVDFTKAFDYVVRQKLWFKWTQLGVNGRNLRSMCANIKSKVKSNGDVSDEFVCMSGVRQGECVSPFLFCMYMSVSWTIYYNI